MTEDLIGFGQDAPEIEEAPPSTDDELKRVAALTQMLARQVDVVTRLEDQLRLEKETLRNLEETDLPEALIAVGYLPPTKTTIAGHEIEFSEKFRCGQLDNNSEKKSKNGEESRSLADRLAGLKWLDENGHGDLIKRAITVTMGRESEDTAAELIALIKAHRDANSFSVKQVQVVWWNTLAAFAQEQIEAREDIPLDTLGVRRVRRAQVKK